MCQHRHVSLIRKPVITACRYPWQLGMTTASRVVVLYPFPPSESFRSYCDWLGPRLNKTTRCPSTVHIDPQHIVVGLSDRIHRTWITTYSQGFVEQSEGHTTYSNTCRNFTLLCYYQLSSSTQHGTRTIKHLLTSGPPTCRNMPLEILWRSRRNRRTGSRLTARYTNAYKCVTPLRSIKRTPFTVP
jgi:hypothetical protein